MDQLMLENRAPLSMSGRSQLGAMIALQELLAVKGKRLLSTAMLSGLLAMPAIAQENVAPDLRPGSIAGTVTDINGYVVPGAEVILCSSVAIETRSVLSGASGSYAFDNLRPGVSYHITISATGFVTWTSPVIVVGPGQIEDLAQSALQVVGGGISITVYASSERTAAEQVNIEERQRVFGVIPNFYVVYDRGASPLTPKLKFTLALKASVDPAIFASTAFVAGIDQADGTPNYRQGAKGYGQRVGALYANGFTDIIVGEAILPSLLHQDPRYFYQGAGTRRSRVFHALSSAFICKGDNGKWEPNYSNIGGDLTAGAVSNIYYPRSNRGAGIVFKNALITAGGRMANGIVQEFVLRRFTTNTRNPGP